MPEDCIRPGGLSNGAYSKVHCLVVKANTFPGSFSFAIDYCLFPIMTLALFLTSLLSSPVEFLPGTCHLTPRSDPWLSFSLHSHFVSWPVISCYPNNDSRLHSLLRYYSLCTIVGTNVSNRRRRNGSTVYERSHQAA